MVMGLGGLLGLARKMKLEGKLDPLKHPIQNAKKVAGEALEEKKNVIQNPGKALKDKAQASIDRVQEKVDRFQGKVAPIEEGAFSRLSREDEIEQLLADFDQDGDGKPDKGTPKDAKKKLKSLQDQGKIASGQVPTSTLSQIFFPRLTQFKLQAGQQALAERDLDLKTRQQEIALNQANRDEERVIKEETRVDVKGQIDAITRTSGDLAKLFTDNDRPDIAAGIMSQVEAGLPALGKIVTSAMAVPGAIAEAGQVGTLQGATAQSTEEIVALLDQTTKGFGAEHARNLTQLAVAQTPDEINFAVKEIQNSFLKAGATIGADFAHTSAQAYMQAIQDGIQPTEILDGKAGPEAMMYFGMINNMSNETVAKIMTTPDGVAGMLRQQTQGTALSMMNSIVDSYAKFSGLNLNQRLARGTVNSLHSTLTGQTAPSGRRGGPDVATGAQRQDLVESTNGDELQFQEQMGHVIGSLELIEQNIAQGEGGFAGYVKRLVLQNPGLEGLLTGASAFEVTKHLETQFARITAGDSTMADANIFPDLSTFQPGSGTPLTSLNFVSLRTLINKAELTVSGSVRRHVTMLDRLGPEELYLSPALRTHKVPDYAVWQKAVDLLDTDGRPIEPARWKKIRVSLQEARNRSIAPNVWQMQGGNVMTSEDGRLVFNRELTLWSDDAVGRQAADPSSPLGQYLGGRSGSATLDAASIEDGFENPTDAKEAIATTLDQVFSNENGLVDALITPYAVKLNNLMERQQQITAMMQQQGARTKFMTPDQEAIFNSQVQGLMKAVQEDPGLREIMLPFLNQFLNQ